MSHANEDEEGMAISLEAEALSLLGHAHADDAPLDAMLALVAFEARSDDHRAALARVTRAWHIVGAIDPAAIPLGDDEPSLPDVAVARRARAGWRRRSDPIRRRVGVVAAAAVAAGVAIVLIPTAPHRAPVAQVYATALGQTRSVRLEDGSRILLGADSRISASIADDRRTVRLVSGQALFTVAPNASRPFVVEAGTTEIRDIGTVFAVTRHADATTIGVTEGVVEATVPGAAAMRLGAGQQVRFDRAGHATVGAIEPGMATGWQTGLLRYNRAPLSDVVADINRYAATPLRLVDPAIAHLPYSGTVRTDAIGEWVSALPYAFPVKVRYRRDGVEIAPRVAAASGR